MTVKLSAIGRDLFEQLTARTFYVVDTEFCTHEGEHHLISLAVVPVVGGRRTEKAAHARWVMNPGVPIDAATSSVHGYTDADVVNPPDFNHYAAVIVDRLSEDKAVLVCHTTIDAHVLKAEFERLEKRRAAGENGIKAGLKDLPSMSVLDTQRLAYGSAFPGVGRNTRISLREMCDLTGVNRPEQAHNALDDARATANALVQLLRHSAEHRTLYSFDSVLDVAEAGTTKNPKGASHIKSRPGVAKQVPDAHLARHDNPLINPVTAHSSEAEGWLELAVECSQYRCPYLRDEAAVAAEHNSPLLMRELMKELPHLTDPGQAGTLLGAVHVLLTATPAQGAKPALSAREALKWWAVAKGQIRKSPPCDRTDRNASCPDCQEGAPCPRDITYLPVAEIATLGQQGHLTMTRARATTDGRATAPVQAWRNTHPEVLAYAMWRVAGYFVDEGHDENANDVLDLAISLNLHTVEPRLAEACCDRLLERGEPDKALKIATVVLAQRTTDTAYDDLGGWILHTENALYAQQPEPPKPITHPREARPQGHVNPRLYS